MNTQNPNPHTVENDAYDAHIVPAETAARKEREGEDYKHTPDNLESANSINTTGGYTVDSEGLANNYAIEPEMYYEVPGDRRAQKAAEAAARADATAEVNTIDESSQSDA